MLRSYSSSPHCHLRNQKGQAISLWGGKKDPRFNLRRNDVWYVVAHDWAHWHLLSHLLLVIMQWIRQHRYGCYPHFTVKETEAWKFYVTYPSSYDYEWSWNFNQVLLIPNSHTLFTDPHCLLHKNKDVSALHFSQRSNQVLTTEEKEESIICADEDYRNWTCRLQTETEEPRLQVHTSRAQRPLLGKGPSQPKPASQSHLALPSNGLDIIAIILQWGWRGTGTPVSWLRKGYWQSLVEGHSPHWFR